MQETYRFVLAVLECIRKNDSAQIPVYQFLAAYQSQLTPELLEAFPTIVLDLLQRTPKKQQASLISYIGTFGSLITQFPLGQSIVNVELAIAAHQFCLQLRSQQAMPEDWAISTINLANAYTFRIKGDYEKNLEKAAFYYEQSLEVFTYEAMPFYWATVKSNLSNVYYKLNQGDRSDNIEKAIDFSQQSLQVFSRDTHPSQWAQSTINSALFYADRILGNRAENIEKSINLNKQALQLLTRQNEPIEWATTSNNLAKSYAQRIRGDRTQNIEEAIFNYEQALLVRTRRNIPAYWAMTMINLATAYHHRIKGDRSKNNKKAIHIYEQAFDVIKKDTMPVEWAMAKNNLAVTYLDLALNKENRTENIKQSLITCQQALEVRTRETMPFFWAESMNNLANAFRLSIEGSQDHNIEYAISAYKQAAEIRTKESAPFDWAVLLINLGSVYSARIKDKDSKDRHEAIHCYRQALEILTPDQFPNECRKAGQLLGDLYAEAHQWPLADNAYQTALDAGEVLYQSSLFRDSQESELLAMGDLFRNTAYTQAKAGHLEAAVVTIERGRARGLSDVLERDRADLATIEKLSPDLYQEYQNAVDELQLVEKYERQITGLVISQQKIPAETLRAEVERSQQRFSTVVSKIRHLPGYESFLAQPDQHDIAASVKPNKPLMYLLSTMQGGLALVVHQVVLTNNETSLEIIPIWLDLLTENAVDSLLFTHENEIIGWFEAYTNRRANRGTWLKEIDRTTQQLWKLGIGVIANQLQTLGISQVIVIPTKYFNFLPLHAAWTKDSTQPTGRLYAIDLVHFAYAPSARSLQAAQKIKQAVKNDSLLLVSEPYQPVTNLSLPNTVLEVEVASSYFPKHLSLSSKRATRKSVLEAIPDHGIIHFAGHGYANFASPLDSGLLMANDETLSLRDLFNLKLVGVRLAILSGCETGLPGTKLPDECVSLPTGLLQAGVGGVVSSLWSVADLSTMVLVVRFYDYWQVGKLEPLQALCEAQKWVRDTNDTDKTEYLESLRTEFAIRKSANGQEIHNTRDIVFADIPKSHTGSSHPFHWAAFTYVGA